ncbi:MAG: glycosyl hydrolase, partial [Anaerolineae bacterium]
MLRKAIISAIILILTVAVWGAAGRSSASHPALADAAVPLNANFGLCFVSAADNLADETRYEGALATGARWDRWPLYWYWVDEGGYVGPHNGGYHDYDTLVSQEIEHGLAPIAILLGTPDQRATGGSADVPPPRVQDKVFPLPGHVTLQQGEVSTATSPPVGLFEPIFADGTDIPAPGKAINRANSWADFVSATVQRYKPGGVLAQEQGWDSGVGVRYWEIWNEPDLNQFWSGTVEEYYRLLEVAYQTIQAADSEATVLLGALAFFEKKDWLSNLLAQTGGDPAKAYFDVFSFHYFWSIYGTEHWLRETRSTLSDNSLSDVPIWITESGLTVWDDFPATAYGVPSDSPWRGTMEEQAAYVIQNAALAFHYGVERYYHFMLHDDCGNELPDAWGLRQNFTPHVCNPAQGKRRPSYAAYQLAAEQYRDLIPLWRTKSSGQDQVAFYRADDGSRVLALWATGGVTVTTTVSATGDTGQLHWIEPISSPLGTTGISRTLTLTPTTGVYTLTLPPATNQNSWENWIGEYDPNYYIGGRPYLLVERDTLPPISSVEPLPPASGLGFVVRWGGEDLGSGIASYDVFYNVDGGPFTTWFTETLSTSASCAG